MYDITMHTVTMHTDEGTIRISMYDINMYEAIQHIELQYCN
jgi:hypothetical protein